MPNTELIERAANIRATLEQNADETERLRRLSDAVVQALKEAGLCRLMVPARLGGYQTDIHTYIAVMAELGRGCGATAWVASLINVCAWLAGLFPERAQQDIWGANPDAWIAGSLAPHGDATPVDGGWRVTGRWMWASGCLHAQWAACGIHMKDEHGGMANLGLSLMPMTELAIEDTWFMAGMKGTGSNTIVARDVFVPDHRFLPYPPAFQGQYRTEHADEIVYRAALVPVTVLILIGAQLGIARAALDHTIANASTRGVTHTNYGTQTESTGFQILVAEAAMKIDTANLTRSARPTISIGPPRAAGIRTNPWGGFPPTRPSWESSSGKPSTFFSLGMVPPALPSGPESPCSASATSSTTTPSLSHGGTPDLRQDAPPRRPAQHPATIRSRRGWGVGGPD